MDAGDVDGDASSDSPSEADGVVAVRVGIESGTPMVSALLADVPRLTADGKRDAETMPADEEAAASAMAACSSEPASLGATSDNAPRTESERAFGQAAQTSLRTGSLTAATVDRHCWSSMSMSASPLRRVTSQPKPS
jgi:hypothetical protein